MSPSIVSGRVVAIVTNSFARFRVDDRIVEIPEMPVERFVEDLVVTHGGPKVGVPITKPFSAVDQAVGKSLKKKCRTPWRKPSRVKRSPVALHPIALSWPRIRS